MRNRIVITFPLAYSSPVGRSRRLFINIKHITAVEEMPDSPDGDERSVIMLISGQTIETNRFYGDILDAIDHGGDDAE